MFELNIEFAWNWTITTIIENTYQKTLKFYCIELLYRSVGKDLELDILEGF